MTQNTNLNVSPYFDDFNEDKNYNKVLFKPGYPIQSRELTTLQSILQNQIEKFGQHFFKEGSVVIPGGTFYDDNYFAVRIDPNFLSVPVSSYISYLVSNNIEIEGQTSGVRATVVNSLTYLESEDGYDTLYVKYTRSGSDGTTKVFQNGENLITLSDINFSSTSISANNQFARCIVSDSTKIGSSASLSEGVFFIRGYFVKVPSSTIILDQYSNSPNYRVGLTITEEIVTASSQNSDLYDNAQGFSNESAPGADRFRITASLSKKLLTDTNDLDFVELMRVENGVLQTFVNKTDYNIFKDELARRTYDESGDYYVKQFALDVRESLNDRIGNNGVYLDTQTTQNGNTPSDNIFTIQVSPGKAYVRGFEIDKTSTTSIDVVKPRTTKSKENVSLPIKIGNVIDVENVYGSPTIGFSTTYSVDLHDRRLADTGLLDGSSTQIGKARVFDFNQKNITGVSTTTYEVRLLDIQTFTNITVGFAITVAADAYVKGKYSGSNGFVATAVSGGTTISLQDVKGEFQINEPLEVNGLDVGRNITVVRDYDLTDVKAIHKAVGVSTFAANVALNREKKSFTETSQFTVTSGGTVTSTSVSDFRDSVKVGDIVRYSESGATLPTLNRVTTVTESNFTVAGIASVTGVCDGGVTASDLTTTDLDILIPSLDVNVDPGYRVKLQNKYISSINLLDSSYIVRKQLTGNVTGTTFTFQLSGLGDNDLYFEPFTESNYILTWESGQKELIRAAQVTFSTDLREMTIVALSRTGNVTLTAACRRSKLTSKSKSIQRCSNLIVDRSKYQGSGIGSTTFGDGLTYSTVYGTRVQDNEISLNVPDISRILAIFESNDSANPDLPSIVVSSQSDTFTNNVIVGEQFIGSESGAVARVVDIVSGTQLNFVYENDKFFEYGESVTLKTSGITATISTLLAGDRNISKNYTLDDGQRLEFCDYGKIIRKKNIAEPTRKLRIIFDYFTNNESSGTIESVNSYNSLDYSIDIPFAIDRRASDFIDIRPRVDAYSTSSTNSPFSFASRSFSSSSSETVVSNKTIVADYSYYLGRVDRLYLTKDGIFEVKKGEPAEYPKAPTANTEGFEVAVISMTPYVFNATIDSSVKTIPHKRFTMSDIGGLESRIKNLEEYTTLSLLETDTKNLSIKDPNTGLDKFKSGFFVDNFRNHRTHNLSGESFFDIDTQRGECRPRSAERNVSLTFETKSSLSDPVNADYRWIEDFEDANITRGGTGLTIAYSEVEFVNQPLATRTENLNPFHIALFVGSIALTPASDFWMEEVILATPDVVKITSPFDGMASLLGVEDRENGGMAASYWNSHEQTWTGRELIKEEVLRNEEVGRETISDVTLRGNGIRRITTDAVTREVETLNTFNETGIDREFGFELTAGEEVVSLGNRVVGVDVLFNCRSRNIEVVGKRLKPNTRYFVFMENVDLSQYAVPKFLPITMVRGSFATGDIVDTVTPPGSSTASIRVRLAQPNHLFGPFNKPSDTRGSTTQYSGTSSQLNIDTAGLASQTRPDHLGWVKSGSKLVNTTGTAEATVDNIQLISDDEGNLIFSLHIPDPKVASNPKFTTGSNTIRLTTSSVNANRLDPGESSAEAVFTATGYALNSQEQTLSIKTAEVERKQIGSDQPITRITQELEEETITVQETRDTGWYDPLAQSFLVDRNKSQDGVFITGGEVFFKTKDDNVAVTVQIRTMRDGTPTTTIVPYGEVNIKPSDVKLSDDGSVPTRFTFDTPVYLQSGYEYALVLVAPTEKYLAFITRMGEEDLLLKTVYNRQPYLGSLFKSQNSSTWTPSQLEDLKFKLFKAKFVTNTPSFVKFYNNELPLGLIRKTNPVVAYSKRQYVSIANTTTVFDQGNTITQGTHTANVFSSGGPIALGTTSTTLAYAGIGLTDGTFTGVGFESLTGFGNSCLATITVSSGAVSSINVTDAGSGYAVGDLLLANQIGATGTGVRAIVGIVTQTNLIVVDDVSSNIVAGTAMTHYNSSGTGSIISAPTSVTNDPIRDGYTMLFDHHNHGMHASTNKVKVVNFASDVAPTSLSSAIDDDTTVITVADATQFANFEGSPVGAANTGYLKIDKEVISYNTVSGNDITITTRVIDSSLKSNHAQNAAVYKYEFNSISLRKINKEHNMDPRDKTFNSYYLKLDDTTKTFGSTKSGGGNALEVSQNIPFEYIDPQFNMITPSGTNVTARIKTTSGTSISGSEGSFQDKGYESVSLNNLNRLDDPRIIASKVNEYNLLGDSKSFTIELALSTTKEDVSPLIDLDRANVIVISNLVDNKVTDFETDSRVRIPGSDPNSAIYETQKILLEFPSNSLYVQFDGHREAEGDIRVFYKLFRSDGSDAQQVYIPFNTDGSPDKTVNPNQTENGFSEYKFTAENTPQFSGFMIKVVMTSTSQAKPPRIKNFRAIALRSFSANE